MGRAFRLQLGGAGGAADGGAGGAAGGGWGSCMAVIATAEEALIRR